MLCDVTGSKDLARRICALFEVEFEGCASITIELLPSKPIQVSFKLLGGEAFERLDWEGHLVEAQVIKIE